MSRSRLAIWNYLSALVFTGVTFLGLFVTKYLVHWLGREAWEASRMVTGWIGFLGVFEIGLSATLAPLLARAVADEDHRALEGYVSAGLRGFLALLVFCLAIATAVAPIVTWLIPVTSSLRPDLRAAWLVAVLGLLPMVLTPFRALAEGRQRAYRINLALTVQSLVIFGLTLAFAYAGWGITGQVAAMTIAALPLALFLTRDGLASFPGLLRGAIRASPSREVWRSIAGLGLATFLIAFSGRISLMTDNLVVGKVLGPDLAGRFDLTLRLAMLAQGQLQNIGTACWAALAELHAKGLRDLFNRRLIELTGLVGLLGVAALGPIAAYTRSFIGLWVGPENYLGDPLVYVVSANALMLGTFSLWLWCFSGTGLARRTIPLVLTSAGVNLAASIGLTYLLGPIGPSLGTTIGFLTVTIWYLPMMLRREFGTPIGPLFAAALRPVALGIPYAALLYWVARAYPPRGWIELSAAMGASALLFLLLGYRLILSPADRATWAARFRSALGRRGASG